MNETMKMLKEGLEEFNKTVEICDYAKGLSQPQFNVLVSMLFDTYATAHEDYNILDNSSSIVADVYRVLERDPHDDMTH